MPRSGRRRVWAATAGGVVVVAAYTALLWPVYVSPQVDRPAPADAIVVLGGAHDGREEFGMHLAQAGYAPQVLFSNPYVESPEMGRICHGGYSFQVSCFRPDPGTTRGEGKEIARRVRAEGWHRVIVVTFTPHVSRARYIIGKCTSTTVLMVPVHPHLSVFRWIYNYVYQSAGYVRALFEDC